MTKPGRLFVSDWTENERKKVEIETIMLPRVKMDMNQEINGNQRYRFLLEFYRAARQQGWPSQHARFVVSAGFRTVQASRNISRDQAQRDAIFIQTLFQYAEQE